ncbi:Hint domain-containing protein [Cochlodiniinecator piscidefendens]|uniref:Hint domain-containing protein n=1 Tax=Cochlodiniinecator piscidefendens TaxID=2715756 RepID=UPI0014083470|nr:Hint domain-containing protein [Cochlodiniinecator piscidefendens]
MVAASELPIDNSATATEMANAIFGDGVTVVGATYNGDYWSSGTYSDGDATSPGVTPGDTGVILSTGYTSRFTNGFGSSNHNTNTSSNTFNGIDGDSDFNALAGTRTYDASILNVDFIPTGDLMTMQFTFSSEEFPEYVSSAYNDVIGVWINGTHVPISFGDGDVNVTNVSQQTNLYQDNTNDALNTEMDGVTLTLSLTIPVNSGVVNSIRIGVADVSDSSYDSTLLIGGDSVQTLLVADDDSTTMYVGGTHTTDLLANDINNTGGTLTITHINGVAVSAGDTVTLNTGQTVTLNADGTVTIVADADVEEVNFTYTTESSTGHSDIGIVTVDTIPCFVAGTLILTPDGEFPVETLQPGDMIETHDHGAQPLRWIGRRTVPAIGNFAPIRIRAKTFGDHETLLVSPQHRVLIRDSLAELLFGETEVLVAAKDLVNDHSVRAMEGGDVEYVHLLFDQHQVIYSEGLATESFLPGPQTSHCFERDIVEEICTIFPELDPHTGEGYSPAARRTLKSYEAQVLFAQSAA